MDKISIVIAEDHPMMREGTRRILEAYSDFKVAGEAEDGKQALELINQLKPDVAILDIQMPGLSGIEVVRMAKKASPDTKTLILTAYDDDVYILALMEAGASGYLLKTAREKELVDSIRSVYSGESVLHPAIAQKVARLWAQRVSAAHKITEQLSPRELEVLDLAAHGLRNKAIASGLTISVHTVEGHFNSIFAKLGVSSRTEAILYALSRHLISLEGEKGL
jgi:DNA-binding NarL/FixJ family response regulator